MLFFMMAPKTRVKSKAVTAGQASVNTRKKQRVSLESTESLPAGRDIVPTLTASSGGDETPALDVASVAGSSSGLEGVTITSSSCGGEVASLLALALALPTNLLALALLKNQAQV